MMKANKCSLILIALLGAGPCLYAAQPAAITKDDLCGQCRQLEENYGKKNQFTELADALERLAQKNKKNPACVNYYIALARYKQLKFLEDSQSWDEYFSRGNDYREAIVAHARKAVVASGPLDAFGVYSRLLLWQFHKDQQDTSVEGALAELVDGVLAFAQAGGDIQVVKDAADALFARDEKVKARLLYKVYVNKVIGSAATDEYLFKTASGFYDAGNTELAEELYEVYIEKIIKAWPKEKIVPALIGIARSFAFKDEGVNDPEYAEKIFQRIEEIAGKDALNEELIYLRAFNLEKIKSFAQASSMYQRLLDLYPQAVRRDEVVLKLGLMSAYCLSDSKSGLAYFEKLTQGKEFNSFVASALYHLGLLSQWAEALEPAKKYYSALIEKTADAYPEITARAKERLLEIEEAKPIEYNLKTFLDSALKDGSILHDKTKLFLRSAPSLAKKNQEVTVGSMPYLVQTGCLQTELQYLWSGSLGTATPSLQEASFKTSYAHTGTKEVFVVVVSATGVVDWDVDFVDIE